MFARSDRTIWRTCSNCGSSFEQPGDPGHKRVYCSWACQQAAYRARQHHSSAQQHTGRQDRRSQRHEQRRRRPRSSGLGAGQRYQQRQDRRTGQRDQRQPPPHSANGQRPGAASGDDLARIRAIIAA